MNEGRLDRSKKVNENAIRLNQESLHSSIIENYYGAHKNFKTNFRNKKYKEVYEQLTRRKPSQPEHMSLYFQDLLVSIIKTI